MRPTAAPIWLAAAALALLATACTASTTHRLAEVALPGETVLDVTMTPASATAGRVRLDAAYAPGTPQPDASGQPRQSAAPLSRFVFAGTGFIAPPMLYVSPWWLDSATRLGVWEPCEIGPIFSFVRAGAEMRCGLLQERDGAPLSVAVGFATTAHFFQKNQGPIHRVSLDLSRRDAHRRWMGNLHLSQGPRSYSAQLNLPDVHDSTDNEDEIILEPLVTPINPWAYLERDELRLTLALGLGWQTDKDTLLSVGIAPRVTLGESQLTHATCNACESLRPISFDGDYGFDLTLGISKPPSVSRPGDDGLPPPGHKPVSSYSEGRLTAGIAIYASHLGFFLPAMATSLAPDSYEGDSSPAPLYLIPLIGPFMWRDALTEQDDVVGKMYDVMAYTGATLQWTGLLYALSAWLIPETRWVPDDTPNADDGPQVQLSPVQLGPEAPGIGASGTF